MLRSLGRLVKRWVLRPLLTVLAILYFLIDALVLGALRPVFRWLGRMALFERLGARVRRLGPYATLILLVIPVVVLEPAKPVGFFLIGTGHGMGGVAMIVVAELLKIVLVERLFHMSKDKLLTIRAFAWGYVRVVRWLDWLKALPPWRLTVEAARRISGWVRGRVRRARAWVIRQV